MSLNLNIKLNSKFIISLCAIASICVGAEESYLKEIAPAQKNAVLLYKKAVSGVDSVHYLRIGRDAPKIDFSKFSGSHLLIKPAGDSNYSTFNMAWFGVKNGKSEWIPAASGNGYTIVLIEKLREKYDGTAGKIYQNFDIWAGEKAELENLWENYLKAGSQIYTQNWIPLLDQKGMSEKDRFAELLVLKGKAFPTTPKEAAKLYVSGCRIWRLQELAKEISAGNITWETVEDIRQIYLQDFKLQELKEQISKIKQADLQEALADMTQKFPSAKLSEKYGEFISQVSRLKNDVLQEIEKIAPNAEKMAEKFLADCRSAMLANQLLDDVELIAVSRGIGYLSLRDHHAWLNYPKLANNVLQLARIWVFQNWRLIRF